MCAGIAVALPDNAQPLAIVQLRPWGAGQRRCLDVHHPVHDRQPMLLPDGAHQLLHLIRPKHAVPASTPSETHQNMPERHDRQLNVVAKRARAEN